MFGANHGDTVKVAGSEKFAITRKPGKKKASTNVEANPSPVDASLPQAKSRKPRAMVRSDYMRRGEDEQDSEF